MSTNLPEGAANEKLGRPHSRSAEAHEVILDTVHAMLQEMSVRDLTMEAVAKKANVGKPTLYRWWPSKSSLVLAMFHERIATEPLPSATGSVETAMQRHAVRLIGLFGQLFGKVMAELIAEGQSDANLLKELYDQHVKPRRSFAIAEVERGRQSGELRSDSDAELIVDAIFGPIYYRMLLGIKPLDANFGERLVHQVMTGVRG